MRGTVSLGGMSTDDPSRGDTLPLLPSRSIYAGGPALELGDVSQSMRDVIALLFCGLFVFATAAAFVAALFILFLVKLQ